MTSCSFAASLDTSIHSISLESPDIKDIDFRLVNSKAALFRGVILCQSCPFYSFYALVLHLNQRALYILSEFFHVIYFELHPFKKHIDIRSLKQKVLKVLFYEGNF